MNKYLSNRIIQFLIIIIAGLLFIPFLGGVHLFDWDEINFAEAAREMIVTKNFLNVQIDFQPFWEKPPLFIWMQVLSMKVFGINEFAARFPNAICGIVTLLVLFHIGRKLLDKDFGLIWVMVYACSILPFFYFKSGIIDPWFNLFIFLGIYYFSQYILESLPQKKNIFVCLSALFIGLAILTKGPVALLIFILNFFIFFIIKMFKVKIKIKHILMFILIVCFVGGFWFILQAITGNFKVIQDFIAYQIRLFGTKDAGHGGFLLYHFVVLFIGVFPASIFALMSFRPEKKYDREPVHEFKNWMMILFWTVLILFTIVKTKIVHYSSLCYFPLTFLGAYVIFKFYNLKQAIPKWMKMLIVLIAIFWGMAIVGLQLIAMNKDKIINSGLIYDQFATGNLQAEVAWSGYEFLIGIAFIVVIILLYVSQRLSKEKQIIATFISTLIFIYASVVFIVPKVEGYSQNAAIEFYKSKQKENCYIQTLGFKSYAHLFYFNKPKPTNPNAWNDLWLINGNVDKPVYFVIKNSKSKEYLDQYPQLKILYEKNGFVFVKRDINDKSLNTK
jgi:4-amino-4-deoxy-L-arabinose transferase-like glycosyltransferase